jgi:hypothetical protein
MDTRLTKTTSYQIAAIGANGRSLPAKGDWFVKAHKLSLTPKNPTQNPTQAQTESERSFWGPHPDPNHNWIEEQLYYRGTAFLRSMLSWTIGKENMQLAKAEGGPPKAPGWGEVAKLFSSPEPAAKKMNIWENLIDAFTQHIFPQETVESVSAAWALRSSMLSMLGDKIKGIRESMKDWNALHQVLPSHRREAIEWQKENGARLLVRLKDDTKQKIKDVLVQSEVEGLGRGKMEQRLMEGFGYLNRDWRRVVLTETAMSAASGQLAQVAGAEGWEAIWTGTPNACPFCHRMYGRSFKIVAADKADKNGDKEVWPGKTNIGRSVSLYTREGRKREKGELWWPCIPAHPNCCCSWSIRRTVTPENATPWEIKLRQRTDAVLAQRRRQDEEFFKYVSSTKG